MVQVRVGSGFSVSHRGVEAAFLEHGRDFGTDLEAIDDGYIAVTPLQLDLTHHSSLGALAARYES